MKKSKDARLLLPGEIVRQNNSNLTVHHVEIVPIRVNEEDAAEVLVCFASGPHPDRVVSAGFVPWPVAAFKPGDKVDVIPKRPKVITTWDDTAGEWKVDVVEEPIPPIPPNNP